jgi:hypothetical protein
MRRWIPGHLLISGVLVATAACATGEEWTTWRSHPTHFASGEHMFFSVRNTTGASPQVTRTEIAKAREEGWWGKPVTVAQDQILDR